MSVKNITDAWKKRIEKIRIDVVTQITEKTSRNAQSGFNKFEVNASTDNPQVSVFHTITNHGDETEGTVICAGFQVLFIEFGVGVNNSTPKNAGESNTSKAWNGSESAIGFIEQGSIETMPRPAGIVPLGQYGKKNGREDYWIRPSALGIPNEYAGESHVLKKNGEPRTDVVWTLGHNPARALYTAYTNARRSVLLQVVRQTRSIKAPRYEQLTLL